jgi:bisphosphoglycerate-independent phosphoglycerate mutase (AlkP superfamily)
MDFQAVRFLAMDRDQRLERLQKFFRELFLTAKDSLDCIDMLKLGIPEEQEVGRLLESFNQAVITSKEIDRYLSDARSVAEAVSDAGDAPQATANWSSQDDSFGMR